VMVKGLPREEDLSRIDELAEELATLMKGE